jgi:trans-2,3-dihydro-3-hydroxyanthranilate isomerase
MFQVLGIDHVVLRVPDRHRALSFYRDVLGLTVEREQSELGLTQLRAGSSLIDLITIDGALGRAVPATSARPVSDVDHFALEIAPFDEGALRTHFAFHGVDVVEAGLRYGAGGEGSSLYVCDPNGIKVELKGPAAKPATISNMSPQLAAGNAVAPRFAIVDVFATDPLTGNPLAVVDGADAFSEDLLRRIAREFNQSETTFLLEPRSGGDRRLRSFTASGSEVYGAGHNALGAWLWLAQRGQLGPIGPGLELKQEIGRHVLPVHVHSFSGRITVTLEQASPRYLREPDDKDALACALRLDTADLLQSPRARVVSTGADHLLVGVVGLEALDRAAPDANLLLQLLQTVGAEGCYLFALERPNGEVVARTRFFNPTVGLWEDSATGSAAGPLASYLVECGLATAGEDSVFEQGRKMGRVSRMSVRVNKGTVSLSGSGHTVAEGRLMLG